MSTPLRADLQLHSTASDGLLTPEELVAALRRADVQVAALTDHDTCNGYPAFAASAAKAGIVPVCGAEIAAEQDGEEVHLLSYFREPPQGRYQELLLRLSGERRERAREMLRRLRESCFPLDEREVLGHAQPGRPHVARAMVRAGAVRDVKEAFATYLSPGGPGYVGRYRPEAADVIGAAHAANGFVSLAHPMRYRRAPIEELARAGIDAVEIVHPSASPQEGLDIAEAAAGFGVPMVTGGSDFHGKPDDPPLGTYVLVGEALQRFLARLGA